MKPFGHTYELSRPVAGRCCRRSWRLLLVVLVTFLAIRRADATTYSFTRIADDNTELAGVTLDVNGLGKAVISGNTVAFRACYGDGAGCGIFTGNGGALTTIVKDGTAAPVGTFSSDFTLPPQLGGPEPFAGRPAISGNTVAFAAGYQFDSGSGTFASHGIFTGSGGAVTAIKKTGDTAPSGGFTSFLDPAISGTTVAFQGGYDTNLRGVFSSSGGPMTTIAKSADMVPPVGALTNFKAPAISGGTVAFEGDYSGGQAIFTGTGGTPTIIAKTGDAAPVGTFDPTGFFEPTIDGTNLAFRARYGGGAGSGIFRWNGTALTTVVKTGDAAPSATFSLFSDPAIAGNNVAFVGNYGAQHALFVSSAGVLTPVIKKGDILFGQTVATVTFEKFGLDPGGSGNLAFSYTLLNGQAGIALAIPGGPPLGDYNLNGVVDLADYVVWRDTLNQVVPQGSGADGNFDGVINVLDYTIWRARFGQQAVPGSASGGAEGMLSENVPEPGAVVLLSCTLAGVMMFGRRIFGNRSHFGGRLAADGERQSSSSRQPWA